jgi:Na+/proline symporter
MPLHELKHVNVLDYLVVGSYLVMLTGVGIYLARFNKSADDFFKGGGKIPWWFSGISTFVAGFSAFMFVAAAGYTYETGLSALVLFTMAVWGYLLGFFVYAILWRRSRLSSPMEFLTKRFSPGTTYMYTLMSIVPAVMGLGLGIYILCIFLATALGIIGWTVNIGFLQLNGLEVSMLVTGLVMLVYTSAGGLWAVVITDVLQFVVILIVSVLIFPLAFMALGDGSFFQGVSRLIQEAPPGYLSLADIGARPHFYLAYALSSLIGYNAAWHIGQRYYSVPSERDARKMAMLNAVLSLFLPLAWVAPTMAAKILFPDMQTLWPELAEPAEGSFVTLALTLLPNGLIGLTLVAILAATMTTIDTSLNYLASILVRDVYEQLHTRVRKVPSTPSHQLLISRVTAFVLGILAIITAILVQRSKGVFDFALMYYSWFAPSMLTPVMLGFLTMKTPSWSAVASAGAGLLTVLLVNVAVDVGPYQYEFNMFAGVGVSVLVFYLSALLPEKNPDRLATLRAFVQDLRTPAAPEGAGWSPQAIQSYRVVGKMTIVIGCATFALAFVPTSAEVRTITIIASLGIIALGSVAASYFRKGRTRELEHMEGRQ